MVSIVRGNASTMNIMIGMGSNPKTIADKIFAKLDRETLDYLNAPDTADARPASVQPAAGRERHAPRQGTRDVPIEANDWQERARVAGEAFAQQMQQIRASPNAPAAPDVPVPDNAAAAVADVAHDAVDLHTLLAGFARPADADGDGQVTSMETLAYSAQLAATQHTKHHAAKPVDQRAAAPVPQAAPERASEHATQSYLAMLQTPKIWTANPGPAVQLAA